MTDQRRGQGSNTDRLLRWALAGHVIHQDDWYSRGADGGYPIKAVRSRIPELERLGYGFHHTARPDGTTEYRLAYVPEPCASIEPELDAAGDVEERTEPLFDAEDLEPPAPSSTSTRPGLYDWDDAA